MGAVGTRLARAPRLSGRDVTIDHQCPASRCFDGVDGAVVSYNHEVTVTPTDPMLGRLIDGRYQVRSRIARGGMATVYLATDLRLERRVAIKIMHGHLADDNTFKSRFVQEARSAARLAHPNVVNVFDQGQDSDMAYLVMEYLPGITLRDLLKDYGRLTPEQTIDIMSAVLSGLAAAHKAGIVHRDMKPENVLLADDGRIKLGDFGLARAASANTATGQALLGTIAYLSPELVTRGVADARSDIYALGIMMYEMLTGEQPFVGEAPMQIAYQHANEQVPRPSSRVPTTPRGLDDLVVWATARDPENRPRDARVMLERLRDVEKLVRDPAGASAEGVAPTMVLPSAPLTGIRRRRDPDPHADPAPGRHRTGPSQPTPAPELATVTRTRARRGYWLFALVLMVAALAGATGWYFGAGPGSLARGSRRRRPVAGCRDGRTRRRGLRREARHALRPPCREGPRLRHRSRRRAARRPRVARSPCTSRSVPRCSRFRPSPGMPEADARARPRPLHRRRVDRAVQRRGRRRPRDRRPRRRRRRAAGHLPRRWRRDARRLGRRPAAPSSGWAARRPSRPSTDVNLVPEEGDLVFSDTVPEGDVVAIAADTDPVRVGDTITLTDVEGRRAVRRCPTCPA